MQQSYYEEDRTRDFACIWLWSTFPLKTIISTAKRKSHRLMLPAPCFTVDLVLDRWQAVVVLIQRSPLKLSYSFCSIRPHHLLAHALWKFHRNFCRLQACCRDIFFLRRSTFHLAPLLHRPDLWSVVLGVLLPEESLHSWGPLYFSQSCTWFQVGFLAKVLRGRAVNQPSEKSR